MIKNSKCKIILGKDSGFGRISLNAKLRFFDQIAPEKRKEVKKRCLKLGDYLKLYENMIPETRWGVTGDFYGYESADKLKKIIVNCNFLPRLSIDIETSSYKETTEEKLINLEALDKYILTGKYPEDK